MTYKTYSHKEHQLPLSKVDADALHVMEKLRSHGHIAYLVGGSVRDLLLDRTPKDFDISTSARPEEIKALFRNCILIGRRFRLAHIRFGKKILEVSTFRSGDNEADTLILRDNKWGSPEEDVLRRDFTINGLFYDSSTEEIIDYVEGYPDLQRHLLRTVGQPFLRFKQDPVRMLRLLKFQARFGFSIDPSVHTALLDCRQEIVKSSPARIQEELLRMLESGASEPFFRLLTEHGFFDLLMPAFGEWMQSSLREEILLHLKAIDQHSSEPLSRSALLACLVFPIFDKRIQVRYESRGHKLHLGEIAEQAQAQIHELFLPFLPLSRKLGSALVTVLASQYRFSEKKKQIPQDPDFFDALSFLQVRSSIEPALQPTWEVWNQLAQDREPRRSRHKHYGH